MGPPGRSIHLSHPLARTITHLLLAAREAGNVVYPSAYQIKGMGFGKLIA